MRNDWKTQWNKAKPYALILFSFLSAVLLIAIVVDLWILPFIIHSGSAVKTPYLVGKNIENAKQLIKSADLDLEKVSEQYSDVYPAGTVMNQIPKPGLQVLEGRNVYLTVSKGKETVKMPFLIGQSLAVARRTLQTSGLILGEVFYANSEGYGRDTVLSQSMNANTDVVYGATINLTVSRGSEIQIAVPNLVGASYSEALELLTGSGLTILKIDTVAHETYMPNTVVSQSPASGELVGKNGGVTITISK
jgi:serine/threonine-protein kinase